MVDQSNNNSNDSEIVDDEKKTDNGEDCTDTTASSSLLSVQEQANELYKGIGLAPMVRASTTPLRVLALNYGANFCYSEELIDKSLLHTQRVVNSSIGTIDYIKTPSQLPKKVQQKLLKSNRPALVLRIDPSIEQSKFICQLGTGQAETAVQAARNVYQDVTSFDVNMGCPKNFSTSGGMGSALLSDPERASSIVRTLRNELPNKPISIKIRLLKDVSSTIDFIETMIQRGRANAIAIHARRVGDESTQPADWDTLCNVLELLRPKYPTFPFLLNGDFYTQHEMDSLFERTKASGILLGRPALYNTSIFRRCDNTTSTSTTTNTNQEYPPLVDKTTVIQEYIKQSVRYDMHYKNTKYVIFEMMSNRRAPTVRVPDLPQSYPGKQTIAAVCPCHSLQEICKVWNVNWSTIPRYTPPSSAQTTTTTTTTTTATTSDNTLDTNTAELAPGEHRYDDSYFLKDPTVAREVRGVESCKRDGSSPASTTTSTTSSATTTGPNKRIRVEEQDSQ